MRKTVTFLVAASALAVGLTTAFASAGAPPGGPPAFVTLVASNIARMAHDPNATAQAVLTRRQAALGLESEDRINEDQQVYYVVLHGHFVDDMAFLPAGAPPPTGHTIGITIDAQTQEILDFSISNGAPNLARLGPPASVSIR